MNAKKKFKISGKTVIKRSDTVIFKEVEGLVYILDHKTMTLKTLNDLASFIWKELETPKAINNLSEKIYQKYNSDKKTILNDLINFINLKLSEGDLEICSKSKR